MMDYNAYQTALTPCQIGRECMNFYRDHAARDYLIPDWCNYQPEKSITISAGEQVEWNGSVDVFGDLIIEKNATLTMHCMVSMPPGSKIILDPRATLILDGCTLTCRCENGQWDGIEISSSNKSKPTIIRKYKTSVEIHSDGHSFCRRDFSAHLNAQLNSVYGNENCSRH
jgi:hypothetical protein